MVDGKQGPIPRVTTWLDPEEMAYHGGGQVRRGRAWSDELDREVSVRAGLPDTFFSIPAHIYVRGKYVAGFVTGCNWDLEDRGADERTLTFCAMDSHRHLLDTRAGAK